MTDKKVNTYGNSDEAVAYVDYSDLLSWKRLMNNFQSMSNKTGVDFMDKEGLILDLATLGQDLIAKLNEKNNKETTNIDILNICNSLGRKLRGIAEISHKKLVDKNSYCLDNNILFQDLSKNK
jgi:hypothetical protein